MQPIAPIALPPTPAVPGPAALRRSAEAFEVAFLSEMLRSAGLGSADDTGFDPGPFTTFLADAHARALVARSGLGLADHIARQLAARLPAGAGGEG